MNRMIRTPYYENAKLINIYYPTFEKALVIDVAGYSKTEYKEEYEISKTDITKDMLNLKEGSVSQQEKEDIVSPLMISIIAIILLVLGVIIYYFYKKKQK